MAFVDGFYSFRIDLNHNVNHIYERIDVKLAKHPEEDFNYLISRLVAFLFSYEHDLVFAQGLFENKEPAFWKKDAIEHITHWGEVGIVEKKKVRMAIRHWEDADIRIYFLNQSEIFHFCQHLKGSTENWASKVSYFLLQSETIETLLSSLNTSNNYTAHVFEDSVMLCTRDDEHHVFSCNSVDIWKHYQESIANAP